MPYYQDCNGRWHGAGGRFVSAATVAASGISSGGGSSGGGSSGGSRSSSGYSSLSGSSSRSSSGSGYSGYGSASLSGYSSPSVSVSSSSSSSGLYQDQSGRWHGSDGKFVSKAAVASAGLLNTSSGPSSSRNDSSTYGSAITAASGRGSGSDSRDSSGYSSFLESSLNSSSGSIVSSSHSRSGASSPSVSSKSSSGSGYYQDVNGRWHGPDGKFASKVAVDASLGVSSTTTSKTASSNPSRASQDLFSPAATSTPTRKVAPDSSRSTSSKSSNSSKVSTSSSLYQDSKGRWHGLDGKFVSKAMVEASIGAGATSSSSLKHSSLDDSLSTSSKSSNSSKLSSSSSFYQDSKGRWHGPDGKFVSKAVADAYQGSSPVPSEKQDVTVKSAPQAIKSKPTHPTQQVSSSFYQDSRGRWHGPDGKFVSAAKVFGESEAAAQPVKNWHLRDADEFQAKREALERWLAHQTRQAEFEFARCPLEFSSVSSRRSSVEADASSPESEEQDGGLVVMDPSGVTWVPPAASNRKETEWTVKSSSFSLHGLQWQLQLACRSGRCRVILEGEAGEERTEVGSGGWICSQADFAVALAGAQVTRRLVRNPTGLKPGHAWMQVDVGAVPDSPPALQVVHVALPPPAWGVAKDLLLLHDMQAGCDVNVKVAGGQLFPAHRAVLDCRSLVLASLLDQLDGTSEDHPAAEVPVLQLQHLTARAAKPFLRYVYAGAVPSDLEDTALTTDLHCAALCYKMTGLATQTRNALRQSVKSTDDVVAVLRALCNLPARHLQAELGWLLARTTEDMLQTPKWFSFMSDHPSQAVNVISALVARRQRGVAVTLPGAPDVSGAVATSSDSGALWCCVPTSSSKGSTLHSPEFTAASATWQLRWTADNTVSAGRLTTDQDDDSEAETVTLLVLSEGSVLFRTVPTVASEGAGMLEASYPDCSRPDGKPFVVYAHFNVPEQPQHRETLLADLGRLLADTPSMDVDVVSLADETSSVRMHQTMLMARSELFRRMFSSGFKEQKQRKVQLPLARRFLKYWRDFLYTERLPEDEEVRRELGSFASKYLLTELEEKCNEMGLIHESGC